MITKFSLFVVIVAVFVYAWMFKLRRHHKRKVRSHLTDVLVAIGVSLLIVVPLFFLNQISGV